MRWLLALGAVLTLAGCGIGPDPTSDRPGEWRTVTSPTGVTYECYVVAGRQAVAIECFEVSG